MASVYILYSKSIDSYYIGSCDDFSFRIDQHLNKKLERSFTKRSDYWDLFFLAEGLNYGQARQIEKHIKNMKSRNYIENLIKYPEILEKLKIKYQ